MKTFQEFKSVFGNFYIAVWLAHKNSKSAFGHGIDHDITVASYATIIAQDERIAELSWVAGMLHSMDHVLGREGDELSSKLRELLQVLPENYFLEQERDLVLEAVLKHGEKFPEIENPILTILQDADRLANLDLLVTIRGGQFRPHIPAVELKWIDEINPESTYRNPKSVFDAIRITVREYEQLFKSPKAKALAEIGIMELSNYIENIKSTYRKLGLSEADTD